MHGVQEFCVVLYSNFNNLKSKVNTVVADNYDLYTPTLKIQSELPTVEMFYNNAASCTSYIRQYDKSTVGLFGAGFNVLGPLYSNSKAVLTEVPDLSSKYCTASLLNGLKIRQIHTTITFTNGTSNVYIGYNIGHFTTTDVSCFVLPMNNDFDLATQQVIKSAKYDSSTGYMTCTVVNSSYSQGLNVQILLIGA